MHGIVFSEMKKYVVQALGAPAWNSLLAGAGVPGKVYLPREVYPDAEAVALVVGASKATGKSVQDVLEGFGEFIAPDLLGMYGAQVHPSWRTIALLEHTEETIHRIVRLKNPGAEPPRLVAKRQGPNAVSITYASDRHLCGLAKGIVRGLARHYGEKIGMEEPTCMNRGDRACTLVVRTNGSA